MSSRTNTDDEVSVSSGNVGSVDFTHIRSALPSDQPSSITSSRRSAMMGTISSMLARSRTNGPLELQESNNLQSHDTYYYAKSRTSMCLNDRDEESKQEDSAEDFVATTCERQKRRMRTANLIAL